MPKCSRCGIRSVFLTYDSMDQCPECSQLYAKEQTEKNRAYNLSKLRQRDVRPAIQRTFDAFVEKYPDALISGVSKQDSDDQLIIHLEGGVDYHVTFDPLINSVHAEKMGAAPVRSGQASSSGSAPERIYGGVIFWSVVAMLYGIFLMLFNSLGGFLGVAVSVVLLIGASTKSRNAIIAGIWLLVLPTLLAFPYSLLYGFVMLCIYACI